MYKIKMLCFEVGNPVPYEDEPMNVPLYKTKDEALQAAYDMALEEINELNDSCDEFVSFGIVCDKEVIRVLYYFLDGEEDTTGNTEQVTSYYIEEV